MRRNQGRGRRDQHEPVAARELLKCIRCSPHPYVWLDALSMPAAVLGPDPCPGSWLVGLSNTLLARMMAVCAAGANTVVLRSSEAKGSRYHQRVWTLQEFCGSRAVTVCTEDNADLVPSTPEEVAEFSEMRRAIKSDMKRAFPLWGQRLIGATAERKEALVRGVEAFAKAQATLFCKEPMDKVRALLPILLNSPVQDAKELRELVDMGMRLALEGALSEEASTAIFDSLKLVKNATKTETRNFNIAHATLF